MKKSHLIAGGLGWALLLVPLATAKWKSQASKTFIRDEEQRVPTTRPVVGSASAALDGAVWRQANAYVNDRVPFRREAVLARRTFEIEVLGKRVFGDVGVGQDKWIFLLPGLTTAVATESQFERAKALMAAYQTLPPKRARLIIVPCPDKHSIYPEELSSQLRRAARPTTGIRRRIQEWFSQPGVPERMDTWKIYSGAKATASEPLFETRGSHHSSYGAQGLCRAMIERVSPGLWRAEDVKLAYSAVHNSDLDRLAGFIGEVQSYNFFELKRPGVELVQFTHDGKIVPPGGQPPGSPAFHTIAQRYIQRSAGSQLIGGRTLIVHDSAIGTFLRPSLRPFFQDVTFIHFKDVRPGDLMTALDDFDLIYVEVVERNLVDHMQVAFAPPAQANGRHSFLEISNRGEPTKKP